MKLTKVKEKWSTIKFDVFVLSFIFLCSSVPENKFHKQVVHAIFYTHQTISAFAGLYMYNRLGWIEGYFGFQASYSFRYW